MAFNLGKLFSEETIEISQEEMEKVQEITTDDGLDDAFKLDIKESEKGKVKKSVIRLYNPITRAILPHILNSIKANELVIVNYSSLSPEDADFVYASLSGSLYSLDGELKNISETVFVCAPKKYLIDTPDSE